MAAVSQSLQWSTHHGKSTYAATGGRDVLFIISEALLDRTPDQSVPRLTRELQLTEEEASKLDHQGIAREHHSSDLSIMVARHNLDTRHRVVGVLECGAGGAREALSCEEVKRQINGLMSSTDKGGVAVYYIGHGRRGTGDWCFSDGCITFQDLANLYLNNKHFCGRVLTIISDCSYSGRWVSSCMEFMDEQGVRPCGHSARERGILIKVLASCQSTEVPTRLSFSVHSARNEKNTGLLSFKTHFKGNEICARQHPSGVDFTQVLCKGKIWEPCSLTLGYTWKKWYEGQRVNLITTIEKGRPVWYYILLADNEEKMAEFRAKLLSGNASVRIADYGLLLKRGWGENPTNDIKDLFEKEYFPVYR